MQQDGFTIRNKHYNFKNIPTAGVVKIRLK